jgi:hypothetical protein
MHGMSFLSIRLLKYEAYLGAHFRQTQSALLSESIQQFALILATATLWSGFFQLRFLFLDRQLLGAFRAKQTACRPSFTVCRDGETLAADLTVLQLARERLRFLAHHFFRNFIVIIVGLSPTACLASGKFLALLDFCQSGGFFAFALLPLLWSFIGMVFVFFFFYPVLLSFPFCLTLSFLNSLLIIILNLGSRDVVCLEYMEITSVHNRSVMYHESAVTGRRKMTTYVE